MLKLGFAIARLGSAVSRFFQGFKDEKKKKDEAHKEKITFKANRAKIKWKKGENGRPVNKMA